MTPLAYTATSVITDALEKLGVYAPGEQIPTADLNRGLSTLNEMIDQWQNEKITLYSLVTQTINLSNGKPVYSIGPKGAVADITTGRPDKIQMGPGAGQVVYSGTTYPLDIVSQLEWSAIQSRNSGGGVPDTLFYDPQYPVGILNFAPSPNQAGMVATFYTQKPFIYFTNLNTSGQFSQGTIDTLQTNLAVSLKPYFSEGQVSQELAGMAQMTKEFLRTTGTKSRAFLKRSPNPVAKPAAPSP